RSPMKRQPFHGPRRLLALVSFLALALVVAAPAAGTGQGEKVDRQPQPDKAALDKSEKILNRMFKDDLAKAKADAAAARDRAEVVLREAKNTQEAPPLRFIALVYARDLAARAGDITTAMAAIEELAKHYTVDTLGMKTKMLSLAAEKATSKEDHAAIVEMALGLLKEALTNADYQESD